MNGLLDVARQTYKEANTDAYELIQELGTEHNLALDLNYDDTRHYYIRISSTELLDRALPPVFVNVVKRKNFFECTTLDLLKYNQKITDSHLEVIQMSDQRVQILLEDIRANVAPLFKVSEAVGILDMMASFAQLVTTQDYFRPELTDALAIKAGRHPIREKFDREKYIPNDVYATRQSRFQIITGCNMSGKSSYIRSIALVTIMSQLGCFVPAAYASFPTVQSLFARVSTDDTANDASTSTFAAEMRDTSFILRNIDRRSLVIIDELGRGTSTRDGLCIAIAVAEALIDSGALVWFVTHFRELPRVLAERAGVVNLHLQVDMSRTDKLKMLYRVTAGPCEEQGYGLALAKVVGLPEQVLKVAEKVSKRLAEDLEKGRKKKSSQMAIAQARRRKLILGLREQLQQAKDGNMRGATLMTWLRALQDEFVMRMAAVDADVGEINSLNDDDSIHDASDVQDVTVSLDDQLSMSTPLRPSNGLSSSRIVPTTTPTPRDDLCRTYSVASSSTSPSTSPTKRLQPPGLKVHEMASHPTTSPFFKQHQTMHHKPHSDPEFQTRATPQKPLQLRTVIQPQSSITPATVPLKRKQQTYHDHYSSPLPARRSSSTHQPEKVSMYSTDDNNANDQDENEDDEADWFCVRRGKTPSVEVGSAREMRNVVRSMRGKYEMSGALPALSASTASIASIVDRD